MALKALKRKRGEGTKDKMSQITIFKNYFLIRCRKEKKLTQKQVAAAIGTNYMKIWRIENNLLRRVDINFIDDLCEFYGLDPFKVFPGLTVISESGRKIYKLRELMINENENYNPYAVKREKIRQEDLDEYGF